MTKGIEQNRDFITIYQRTKEIIKENQDFLKSEKSPKSYTDGFWDGILEGLETVKEISNGKQGTDIRFWINEKKDDITTIISIKDLESYK